MLGGVAQVVKEKLDGMRGERDALATELSRATKELSAKRDDSAEASTSARFHKHAGLHKLAKGRRLILSGLTCFHPAH